MFSSLRQGSIIYILDKSEPSLKIGQINSISLPVNNYGTYGITLSTINLNVKVDNSNQEFKSIPSNLSVAIFGNIFLAETKELISQEVENMMKTSQSVLDSVEMHKNQLNKCELILKDLNPLYAKQKDQEEKINNLETKLGGIEYKLDNICSMLLNSNNSNKDN